MIIRARDLCESWGGRPGLEVPNCPYGLCGRKATLNVNYDNNNRIIFPSRINEITKILIIEIISLSPAPQHAWRRGAADAEIKLSLRWILSNERFSEFSRSRSDYSFVCLTCCKEFCLLISFSLTLVLVLINQPFTCELTILPPLCILLSQNITDVRILFVFVHSWETLIFSEYFVMDQD